MARDTQPTMLEAISRQLKELEVAQKQLATDLKHHLKTERGSIIFSTGVP